MRSLGKNRKASSEIKCSPPTKKYNTGGSPKKDKKEAYKITTRSKQKKDSESTLILSSPKPPQTPRSASNLGLSRDTAKNLLKYGSKLRPLYNMLYGSAHIVLQKKPETEEEFNPLLDELVAQLIKDPSPFEKKTFSTISKEEFASMYTTLNITVAGTNKFADTQILHCDITIPESSSAQASLVRQVNLSGVTNLYSSANKQTEAGCRLNIGLYLGCIKE